MATITLVANTNYSALSVANGDTIALAGRTLTLDVVPAETGVTITTAGTAGRVVFSLVTTYPLVGWTMTAGTGALVALIAAGVTVGANIFAGASFNSQGVNINDGTITGAVTGGSGTNTAGVNINNGTITGAATGGTGTSAKGVAANNGTITGAVAGGSGLGAFGVAANNGTITGAVDGGVKSGAFGVNINSGNLIGGLNDNTAAAVGFWYGSVFFVDGPLSEVTFPSTVATLYLLNGPLSGLATVDGGTTVIELFTSSGIQIARGMHGGMR